jgi:Family of unknown function (DUF5681)
MIQHDNKFKPGNPNWKPGQSGNPKGRPVGSRQKIAEQLLTAFAAVLDEDPVVALRELKQNDPAKFWTIASGLLPKETLLSVQQVVPGGLEPAQWAQLRRVLDLIERYAPATEPEEVFATVEAALIRAYEAPEPLAIEHQPTIAMETVAALPPPPYR